MRKAHYAAATACSEWPATRPRQRDPIAARRRDCDRSWGTLLRPPAQVAVGDSGRVGLSFEAALELAGAMPPWELCEVDENVVVLLGVVLLVHAPAGTVVGIVPVKLPAERPAGVSERPHLDGPVQARRVRRRRNRERRPSPVVRVGWSIVVVESSPGGGVDPLIVPRHEPGMSPAWDVAAAAEARWSRLGRCPAHGHARGGRGDRLRVARPVLWTGPKREACAWGGNAEHPPFFAEHGVVVGCGGKQGAQGTGLVLPLPIPHDRPDLLFIATAAGLIIERHDRRPDLGMNDCRWARTEVWDANLERPHAADPAERFGVTQPRDDWNSNQCLATDRTRPGELPHRLRPAPELVEAMLGLAPFAQATRRAHHQSFNALTKPEPIPRATDYCTVITSDVPIVVQHTRLDSRQAANSVFSTIGYAAD